MQKKQKKKPKHKTEDQNVQTDVSPSDIPSDFLTSRSATVLSIKTISEGKLTTYKQYTIQTTKTDTPPH
jgi:hypothetical protein